MAPIKWSIYYDHLVWPYYMAFIHGPYNMVNIK